MKFKAVHLHYLGFFALYLFALFLWSQPYQDNVSPYGEWDALSHYGIANHMHYLEHSFSSLPVWMDYRYGNDNKFMPHHLWYPPPFHTNLAAVASFSDESILPIFFMNTVFATAILLAVFFVIRRFYGFLPAILSSLLLTFSLRDIQPYLWGQWPERFGYAFFPIILYCYYKYHESVIEKKRNLTYLFLIPLLGVCNFFIHPLGFSHTAVGLLVLALVLAIKDKKIPWPKPTHLVACALIFLSLVWIFPYQTGSAFVRYGAATEETDAIAEINVFERLTQWAMNPEGYEGSVPASYFSFDAMHGMWTLPFLLLGIALLLLRRKRQDLFMLAWLVALYFILHRDLIGMHGFLHRSLSASAHLFVPLTILGLLLLPKVLPIKKNLKLIMTGVGVVIVLFFSFTVNYGPANTVLNDAYASPVARMNSYQLEAGKWISENLPADAAVLMIGSPRQTLKNSIWMAYYANRNSGQGAIFNDPIPQEDLDLLETSNILVDYSETSLFGEQGQAMIAFTQQFEQNRLVNRSVIYQNERIRIYEAP